MTRALLALLLLAACDGAAPLDAGLDGGPEPDGGPANGEITCEQTDAGEWLAYCPEGTAAWCYNGTLERYTRIAASREECWLRGEPARCEAGWACPVEFPVAHCIGEAEPIPIPGPCPGD